MSKASPILEQYRENSRCKDKLIVTSILLTLLVLLNLGLIVYLGIAYLVETKFFFTESTVNKGKNLTEIV